MRKTVYPRTSLQVIIPLASSISAAMMLDQGLSIHHEAHEGHEERTTGFQHAILFLRALRVLRGGVLRMKYQQRETLH